MLRRVSFPGLPVFGDGFVWCEVFLKGASCGQWRSELRVGNFWNVMQRKFSYSVEPKTTEPKLWDKNQMTPRSKFRMCFQISLKVLTQRSSLIGPFPSPASPNSKGLEERRGLRGTEVFLKRCCLCPLFPISWGKEKECFSSLKLREEDPKRITLTYWGAPNSYSSVKLGLVIASPLKVIQPPGLQNAQCCCGLKTGSGERWRV